MRLILVRHGETGWNAENRYQGATDVPLSARGQAQAKALAARLASGALDAIYSSDLQRAWETAARIAASHALQVLMEPRLREMSFGTWEGMTYEEIQRLDPQALAEWMADPLTVAPPRGESLAHLATRIGEMLDDMMELARDETVVLVAHGGSLRVLLCLAMGLDPNAHWRFELSPGSISELHLYRGGAILSLLNDQHHLKRVQDDC